MFQGQRYERIGPDWIMNRITDRITEKKSFKGKKIQKNQIVYEIVINRKVENQSMVKSK